MGMFDTYKFRVPETCPKCSSQILDAQGKFGPCLLLVYTEGSANVHHQYDHPSQLVTGREVLLPDTFEVYELCKNCGAFPTWTCIAKDGVWQSHHHSIYTFLRMLDADISAIEKAFTLKGP